MRDIVITIYQGDDVENDLVAIKSSSLYESGDDDLILAFVEQIAVSEEASWKLKEWGAEYSPPHFNVSAITWMQTEGLNLYRIRPLSRRLKKYRILYAYNGQRDEVYLLAVVLKKPDATTSLPGEDKYGYYNYERESDITRRVFREYEQLGLPHIR